MGKCLLFRTLIMSLSWNIGHSLYNEILAALITGCRIRNLYRSNCATTQLVIMKTLFAFNYPSGRWGNAVRTILSVVRVKTLPSMTVQPQAVLQGRVILIWGQEGGLGWGSGEQERWVGRQEGASIGGISSRPALPCILLEVAVFVQPTTANPAPRSNKTSPWLQFWAFTACCKPQFWWLLDFTASSSYEYDLPYA